MSESGSRRESVTSLETVLDPGRRIVVSGEAFGPTAAALLAEAIRRGGSDGLSLALTGGGTAPPVYEALADTPALPWKAVRIFFGDERGVSPDDPDSNYRMARETLLSRIPVPTGRVFRMEAEREDREAAADDYAAALPARLDLLLLGIGPDGHTASLFPGEPTLNEVVRRVVPALAPPDQPPRPRLTVTPPVLRAARQVVMLAAGEEKAEAVRRALEGPWDPAGCPAQLARDGIWVLDTLAAEALEERSA